MGNPYSPTELATLRANRERLVAKVAGDGQPRRHGDARMLGLELERFVVDMQTGEGVTYLDEPGILDLLDTWEETFPELERTVIDGRLFGFTGVLPTSDGDVGLSITLEPGSQLEASVGPAAEVTTLMKALETFDDEFAEVTERLGVDWQLVAMGVNPLVVDPRDIPLIPKERYRLMDAYLSKRGTYARSMMRVSASTQVSIDCGYPCDLARIYRLAVALGPIFSFLCQNVLSWRGLRMKDTPNMVRSRIWSSVDEDRCGTVPGTFSADFSAETYVDWLMGIAPILFTSDAGMTVDTGNATVRDICAVRELSDGELAHLLSMVFPDTRLKGFLEIRDADSLPPRLAGAYAALVKGVFYGEDSFEQAYELLARGRRDGDIPAARLELESRGWEAEVYGLPMATIVGRLVQLAENGLQIQEERELFHGLSDLWTRRMIPSDLLMEK